MSCAPLTQLFHEAQLLQKFASDLTLKDIREHVFHKFDLRIKKLVRRDPELVNIRSQDQQIVSAGDWDITVEHKKQFEQRMEAGGHLNDRIICSPLTDDSFQGALSPCVALRWSTGGHPAEISWNGTLVRYRGAFYVFSVVHSVVVRTGASFTERDDIHLLMMPESPGSQATAPIELAWKRCIHSAPAYYSGQSTNEMVINDCSVFELEDPPAPGFDLASRALSLFDWKDGARHPTSKILGVSLMLDVMPGLGSVPQMATIFIEERGSVQWAASSKYVMLPHAVSKAGQSGTGLTDKKLRLVAVISGNFDIESNKVAIGTAATQHQALVDLLLAHSPVASFLSKTAKADQAAEAAKAAAIAAAAASKKRSPEDSNADVDPNKKPNTGSRPS